jgi:signal peptidase II
LIARPLGFVVALSVLAIDQAVKAALLTRWTDAHAASVPLAPFLNLTLRWNRGVSFSLFAQNSPAGLALLLGLTVTAIVVLLWWLSRAQTDMAAIGLGAIIGGAIGNAADRVAHGAVLDYLDLHALGWNFFVFNFADAAISVGVALLAIDLVFGPRPTVKMQDPQSGP